jgi:hypothetical protein
MATCDIQELRKNSALELSRRQPAYTPIYTLSGTRLRSSVKHKFRGTDGAACRNTKKQLHTVKEKRQKASFANTNLSFPRSAKKRSKADLNNRKRG